MKVAEKTTLLELSREVQKEYEDQIILAKVNGNLKELHKVVEAGDEVEFLTASTTIGNQVYRRGVLLVFLKAIYAVLGDKGLNKVRIEHSIGDGIYGELEGDVAADPATLELVKQEMLRIVEANITFDKRTVKTDEAREIFRRHRMYDKEKLFRYRRVSKTNIYSLGGFEDYFYGFMPSSTGILDVFDLFSYNKGFILHMPNKKAPRELQEFTERKKFFNVLQESSAWGRIMGVQTIGDMNDVMARGELNEMILVQEAFMEKKIGDIAAEIKKRGNVKFVMIAGPSSSGKTTFSHRLSIQLKTLGMKPHPIAVDDYFVDREKTPRQPNGDYDFECLGAIDVEQFNHDMCELLAGKKVELPHFNFVTGKREYKGNFKQLGPDDILVIEGIHGLNDKMSYSLPAESKYKIYISALTTLNVDEHNRIPTTDGRLLRRMVRDARTRGASAKRTIQMWPSVRRGEEENIFPFQESADAMFNSALIYEISVLKQFAEPLLHSIQPGEPEYFEAVRMLKFLSYFLGVSTEDLPKNSIVREFVGGSCFKV